MLFFLTDVLLNEPGRFLTVLPVFLVTVIVSLLVALTVHEFAHAWTAHRLGDDTAKRLGRVSLNPIRHLDPLGTIMIMVAGIGWGKPVPVNPMALPNARRGMAAVAAAGPMANLVTAGLLAIPFQTGWLEFRSPAFLPASIGSPDLLSGVLAFAILFNLLLGFFNLLPLGPLDGFKVALGFFPRRFVPSVGVLEQYGMGILLLLFAVDWFSDMGLFWRIVRTPADFLGSLFVGEPFL